MLFALLFFTFILQISMNFYRLILFCNLCMYIMCFDYFCPIAVNPASSSPASSRFSRFMTLVLFCDPCGLLRAICVAVGLELYLRAVCGQQCKLDWRQMTSQSLNLSVASSPAVRDGDGSAPSLSVCNCTAPPLCSQCRYPLLLGAGSWWPQWLCPTKKM